MANKIHKLTSKRTEMLIESITSLSGKLDACRYAGIDYRSFDRWYREVPEFKEKIDKATEEAIMNGKQIAIKAIFKAMDKNWMAAAWWLERNFPNEYGRKDRIDMDVKESKIVFQIGWDNPGILPEPDDIKQLEEKQKKLLPE